MSNEKGLPRLWKTTVTYRTYVLAHSREAAEDYALRNKECADDAEFTGVAVAEPVTDVRSVDDPSSLPWIASDVTDPDHREDLTIRGWIERLDRQISPRPCDACGEPARAPCGACRVRGRILFLCSDLSCIRAHEEARGCSIESTAIKIGEK